MSKLFFSFGCTICYKTCGISVTAYSNRHWGLRLNEDCPHFNMKLHTQETCGFLSFGDCVEFRPEITCKKCNIVQNFTNGYQYSWSLTNCISNQSLSCDCFKKTKTLVYGKSYYNVLILKELNQFSNTKYPRNMCITCDKNGIIPFMDITCTVCNGTGKKSCHKCAGSGVIGYCKSCSSFANHKHVGHISCFECNGSGKDFFTKEECVKCDDSGKKLCTFCKYDCSLCINTGYDSDGTNCALCNPKCFRCNKTKVDSDGDCSLCNVRDVKNCIHCNSTKYELSNCCNGTSMKRCGDCSSGFIGNCITCHSNKKIRIYDQICNNCEIK